jgi:hypothetical protein
LPSLLSWCCPHTNKPANKVFSNNINDIDTATDPITIADDVAIMLDEGEFYPAAMKPVFGNLLLRGGVVPPRDNKDSLGMSLTSKDLPDSKPKWGKVDKTTLHDLINDGSVEDSLGKACVQTGGDCVTRNNCCKYKLLLYEAS